MPLAAKRAAAVEAMVVAAPVAAVMQAVAVVAAHAMQPLGTQRAVERARVAQHRAVAVPVEATDLTATPSHHVKMPTWAPTAVTVCRLAGVRVAQVSPTRCAPASIAC